MKLKDRTAVVTGAASGIGRATAETLAAEGAYVFLGDIDEEKGRAAAAELSARGLGAEFVRLDVTLNRSRSASSRSMRGAATPISSPTSPAGAGSSRSWRTRRSSGAR